MQLYEVPRNSEIRIQTDDGPMTLLFHHIDGLFSYCTDPLGNVVHVSALTEVTVIGDTGHG